jgi:hypothetical protein
MKERFSYCRVLKRSELRRLESERVRRGRRVNLSISKVVYEFVVINTRRRKGSLAQIIVIVHPELFGDYKRFTEFLRHLRKDGSWEWLSFDVPETNKLNKLKIKADLTGSET